MFAKLLGLSLILRVAELSFLFLSVIANPDDIDPEFMTMLLLEPVFMVLGLIVLEHLLKSRFTYWTALAFALVFAGLPSLAWVTVDVVGNSGVFPWYENILLYLTIILIPFIPNALLAGFYAFLNRRACRLATSPS